MIRVNLLPEEERAPEPTPVLGAPRRGFWLPLVIGGAVLLPLVGLGLMQQVKLAGLRSDISMAEAETRRLKPQIEKIHALMSERSEINRRLVTVQMIARDRYLPVQMLDELADRTPDYLWLTKVDNSAAGMLTIEGMAFSNLLVADLMSRMSGGDIFEDVSLSLTEKEEVGGQPVVRFELNTKIKP